MPDNCDILIDGEYQDASPCSLTSLRERLSR